MLQICCSLQYKLFSFFKLPNSMFWQVATSLKELLQTLLCILVPSKVIALESCLFFKNKNAVKIFEWWTSACSIFSIYVFLAQFLAANKNTPLNHVTLKDMWLLSKVKHDQLVNRSLGSNLSSSWTPGLAWPGVAWLPPSLEKVLQGVRNRLFTQAAAAGRLSPHFCLQRKGKKAF